MTFGIKTISLTVVGVCLAGCQMQRPQPVPAIYCPEPAPTAKNQPSQPSPPRSKKRTAEQMQMLQDFAMRESPRIWQTIQALRGEMDDSGARLKQLRADLQEFGRNPDSDDDYKALATGREELRHAIDTIFDKLEDAYIASKKFEASPSRKGYQDMMKRALEDGIQDANMATERYKAMTRRK